MENLLNKFDDIILYIKESALYKNYLNLSDKLSNNKEVMEVINEVKGLQKKAVNMEYRKEDITEINSLIEDKLNYLNSIPLYIEYKNVQDKLNEELLLIKEDIDNYIKEVI